MISKFRPIFMLTALPCAFFLSGSNAQELRGRNGFQTIQDGNGNSVEARILYVGENHIYLQRSRRDPQRIPRSKLDDETNSMADSWKEQFQDSLTEKELMAVQQTAMNGSGGLQPLILDPADDGTWQLNETFSDEFNDRSIDGKKWNTDMSPWGERAWRSENLEQKNGKLLIGAQYDPHRDRKGREYFYTLGILRSRTTTTYGYFEARIKGCSRFPGLCPAFWLYSSGGRNPDYPNVTYSEIDIVEMLQGNFIQGKGAAGPNHIDMNLHTREIIDGVETWRRPQHWPEVCKNDYEASWDPRDDFHVYAAENTPTNITWYIDGVKVAESPNHNWHLPMYVTLTMELRPPLIRWAGEDGREPVPEAATPDGFPTHMEVDYVRSWTRAK